MATQPFQAGHSRETIKCLICKRVIAHKEKKQTIGTSGLRTVKEKSALWAKIQAPATDEHYGEFAFVLERIKTTNTKRFQTHSTSRLKFKIYFERKQKGCGSKEDTEVIDIGTT